MNLVEKSHEEVLTFLSKTDGVKFAVDATLGNGKDSLFLARALSQTQGKDSTLFGFDIQVSAVENSCSLLEKEGFKKGDDFHFFLCNHKDAKTFLEEKFGCDYISSKGKGVIMFNLGWLPSSDKEIVTLANSTLSALVDSLEILRKTSGFLSVLSYRAHEGGMDEYLKVRNFFETSAPLKDFKIFGNEKNPLSPILFTAEIRG